MIIWSSQHIPELAELPIEQRQQRIQQAIRKLTPAQKLLINLVKLLLLIPAFIFAARLGNWLSLFVLFALAIVYPTVMRPLNLTLARKHL